MMNIVKTIIIQLAQGVLGLVLGSVLYIGMYYANGYSTKIAIGIGLLILIRVWALNRTSTQKTNVETIEEESYS